MPASIVSVCVVYGERGPLFHSRFNTTNVGSVCALRRHPTISSTIHEPKAKRTLCRLGSGGGDDADGIIQFIQEEFPFSHSVICKSVLLYFIILRLTQLDWKFLIISHPRPYHEFLLVYCIALATVVHKCTAKS